jgi:predicted HD phosphohydrolase
MEFSRLLHYLEQANLAGYIGESVSQLEHGLQAAYFADKQGHCESVVIASLLHDIGHFAHDTPQESMADLGVIYHEWIGAKFVYEAGFSAEVAWLIGNHVDAKRYLAAKKPAYLKYISEASLGTLVFQGGPMTVSECLEFESLPMYREILQVRTNDEKAKEVNLVVPFLTSYLPRLRLHIDSDRCRGDSSLPCSSPYNKAFAEAVKEALLNKLAQNLT